MARRFILEVRKAPYSPKAPYLVHVPKSLHAAEGAQRRFFEKEAIARAYVKRLAKMLGEYQLQALGLNDEQKVEAARCYRLLEKHDAGLLAAVQHYIAYLEQASASVPVSHLLELFLDTKKQDGISRKYLADLRSKLGRFVAAFPEKLACDLSEKPLVTSRQHRSNISLVRMSWSAHRAAAPMRKALRVIDHQQSYLRAIFGVIGITDLTFVRAEGTA